MSEFFKKLGVPFYLSLVACVLTAIGIITTCVGSGVQGYAMSSLGGILFCAIAAIVLMVAGAVLSKMLGAHHFIVVALNLVALILLCVAFANVILERAVLASAQFSYDSVNTVGWGVLYNGFASIALFLISAVLLVVGAFFKDKKA